MKQIIKSGTTSKRLVIFVQDASKTTGVGLKGLTSASSGLIWYYYRDDETAAQAVIVVGETLGTWTSGGFVEIDSTHLPGFYEIGVPNAAIASTNTPAWVYLQLSGVTNMVPVNVELELSVLDLTASVQPANVQQWLGTSVTAATGGVPDVNVKNYNNQTAATDANNLPKVDLEDIHGTAVSTASAQLGVNVVQYAGATAAVDANNLPKVDAEDWKGTAVSAPNVGGVPKVDVVDWLGTGVSAVTGGIPDVNVKNWNNHVAKSDANNYPEVDVEDVIGSTATGGFGTNVNVTQWLGTSVAATIGGIPDVNVADWRGTAVVVPSTGGQPKVEVAVNDDKTGYSLTQTFPTRFSSLAIDASGNVTVGTNNDKSGYTLATGQFAVKKNQALAGVTFSMYSVTTGQLLTGLTVISSRSIDGGTVGLTTNSVIEVGNGLYKLDLSAADLNGNSITLILTATGAADQTITFFTQA